MTNDNRRRRSLQTCHRYSLHERPHYERPKDSGAYVPQLSETLETDPNLTDGARRIGRLIAAIIYRQNRARRFAEITVTYLMRAARRSRRTVQRCLRLLEEGGYIESHVLRGHRSRLCTGLLISLCAPILAKHHRREWPCKQRNPGAPQASHNYRFKNINSVRCVPVSVRHWSTLCMDGVFRSLMKTLPLPAGF